MAPVAKSTSTRQSIQSIPRGLLGFGAALLLFLACRVSGAVGSGDEPPAPPVCDTWHRGSGDSQPIDLERIRRGYVDLKDRPTGSLPRGIENESGGIGPQG